MATREEKIASARKKVGRKHNRRNAPKLLSKCSVPVMNEFVVPVNLWHSSFLLECYVCVCLDFSSQLAEEISTARRTEGETDRTQLVRSLGRPGKKNYEESWAADLAWSRRIVDTASRFDLPRFRHGTYIVIIPAASSSIFFKCCFLPPFHPEAAARCRYSPKISFDR